MKTKWAFLADTETNYKVMGGDSRHVATYNLTEPYKGRDQIRIELSTSWGRHACITTASAGQSILDDDPEGNSHRDILMGIGYQLGTAEDEQNYHGFQKAAHSAVQGVAGLDY